MRRIRWVRQAAPLSLWRHATKDDWLREHQSRQSSTGDRARTCGRLIPPNLLDADCRVWVRPTAAVEGA
jgi:hypothetical protein